MAAKGRPATRNTAKTTKSTVSSGKAGAKAAGAKAAGAKAAGAKSRRAAPPPPVGRPKPWGMIAAVTAVVLFAVAVIGYAVLQVQEQEANTPEAKAEAAREIDGITTREFPAGQHKTTPIEYQDSQDSPPFGGEHDPTWADCTGTVYSGQIRSENAVHSLEHGAIWITYRPGLSQGDVDKLKEKVEGTDFMMLSPYEGLKTPVSLQAWGFQLFVDSVDDERIDEFIDDLRLNSTTVPEFGASCVNPEFKSNPLAPGETAPPASPAPTASP
jgi:Protein of unknown function (DUF3105)